MPFLVHHPWAYPLETGARGVMTYTHVLTDLAHGDKLLLYRGRLKYFALGTDGTFSYVVLAATEQRFLRLDEDEPYLGDKHEIGAGEDAELSAVTLSLRKQIFRALIEKQRRRARERYRRRLVIVRNAEHRFARAESRHQRRQARQKIEREDRRQARCDKENRRKTLGRWRRWVGHIVRPLPFVGRTLQNRRIHRSGEGAVMVIPGTTIKDVVFQGVYQIADLLQAEGKAADLRELMSASPAEQTRVLKEFLGNRAVINTASTRPPLSTRRVQQALFKFGLYKSHIDGVAGPRTRDAVTAFQRAHGLTPDGHAGPATSTRLQEVLNSPRGNASSR
ncbi:MAG TPA: peptidoglycan-binding domain-containing protein [Longimicrobiaceae bacterium]|nr:peptidoglycan-binding domain-containing protein [Longimicrobiaceae bacterium]